MKLQVPSEYNAQNVYNDVHRLLLQAKLSHYGPKSFASHDAFGRTYDSLNEIVDQLTEKLIGYSEVYPINITIGIVNSSEPKELGKEIITIAKKIEEFAESKEYCDIENLAQELSGIGAQLKFLSAYP